MNKDDVTTAIRKCHEREHFFSFLEGTTEMRTIAASSVLPLKTMAVTWSGEYTEGRTWTMGMIHELESKREEESHEKVWLSHLPYSALHGSRMVDALVDSSSWQKIPQPSHHWLTLCCLLSWVFFWTDDLVMRSSCVAKMAWLLFVACTVYSFVVVWFSVNIHTVRT
jgi:hypothetical protein